jgi:hypothetical protein
MKGGGLQSDPVPSWSRLGIVGWFLLTRKTLACNVWPSTLFLWRCSDLEPQRSSRLQLRSWHVDGESLDQVMELIYLIMNSFPFICYGIDSFPFLFPGQLLECLKDHLPTEWWFNNSYAIDNVDNCAYCAELVSFRKVCSHVFATTSWIFYASWVSVRFIVVEASYTVRFFNLPVRLRLELIIPHL